jgi:PAS domain S-box-containing protein
LSVDSEENVSSVEAFAAAGWSEAHASAVAETLFHGATVGIAYLDLNCRYIRINRYLAATHGLSPESHIGKSIFEIIPSRAKHIFDQHRRVVESGKPILDFETTATDGCTGQPIRSCLTSIYPVYDSARTAIGTLAIVNDITFHRRTEEHLRQFKFFSDNASDPHYLVSRDGKILYTNRVACEKLGYSEEELLRLTIFDIDPTYDVNRFAEQLDQVHASAVPSFERWHRRMDGSSFPVEVSVIPVTVHGQPHLFGVARDISERKAIERSLRMQADKLTQSNAELEQFAYAASHDLQEPLRMVISYLNLLERKYKGELDEDAEVYMKFAVDGALRMHQLINDLLKYSRIVRNSDLFQPTDCRKALDKALANLHLTIEETGAEITAGPLPVVLGNESQLAQLFQNLISNALKFRRTDCPKIRVQSELKGMEWIFSVTDNGIGMESQYLNRIFVIFQRLHFREEYPGTGIGLALCKKIIEKHNGRIWASSMPQKGSTFHFSIPAEGFGLSEAKPLRDQPALRELEQTLS